MLWATLVKLVILRLCKLWIIEDIGIILLLNVRRKLCLMKVMVVKIKNINLADCNDESSACLCSSS